MTVRDLRADLATTPAQVAFRDELRGWLEENLTDEFMIRGLWDPTGAAGEAFEARREWQRRLHKGGWSGVHWPAEHGGRGASLIEYAIWLVTCAEAGAPEPVGVIGLNMVGPTLIHHGSPRQQRHLAAILSSDEVWCQLFSEPDAGSDLGNVQTRAVPDGEGGWKVRGQKVWTSWAEYADHGLLLARTGERRFSGLSVFLVDMQSPGVTTRPLVQMSGEAHFSEVFLDDVRLASDALVGPLNHGWTVATSTLVHERTTAILGRHAATAAAAGELLELADRVRAAPDQRQEAVRLWSQAQLLRLNGHRGVAAADVAGGEAQPVSYTQRLHWGLTHRAILDLGVSLMGPQALAGDSTQWSRLACASRGWTIGGGTSEVQRNMLAEKVLGLPR
jgi:alkylation response protein AidB-like acyl-CoA dehydrogenase